MHHDMSEHRSDTHICSARLHWTKECDDATARPKQQNSRCMISSFKNTLLLLKVLQEHLVVVLQVQLCTVLLSMTTHHIRQHSGAITLGRPLVTELSRDSMLSPGDLQGAE